MKPAVVYHWWSEWSDASPMRNLRTPILLSIATLRGSDPNIPIYVLDCGNWKHNRYYFDYPERLNFQVIPWKFHLLNYSDKPGWKFLSRLFDLKRFSETIPEDVIIYCDTDVFWKDSPLPLLHDSRKFCYNQYNTGYFYFKKDAVQFNRFFEIFESYTITALNDENFRSISRQYVGYDAWYYVFDEAILSYMYHKHRELFNIINNKEHCTLGSLLLKNKISSINHDDFRMIHANAIKSSNEIAKCDDEIHHCRGIIPLIIKEFYDSLTKVIEPEDAYSADEISEYLPLQVSLCDPKFLQSLINKKTLYPYESYDLMAALKDYHKII